MTEHTIIVVDDDISTRRLLQLSIERAGYRVILAENGQDALEKALATPPDLILSDVVMPNMTGFELCHALRHDSITRAIPIILLTAQGDTQHVIRGFQAGADEYITKPFDIQEVLVRVERVLRWVTQKKDAFPEITGTLEKTPPFELLRFCEEHRISGIVHLARRVTEGEQQVELTSKIHLTLGEIISIELKDTTEVVEALDQILEWRDGTFRVEQEELHLPADESEPPLTIPDAKPTAETFPERAAEKREALDAASRLVQVQPLLQRIRTELDAAETVAFVVMGSTVLLSNAADVESSGVGDLIAELMELSESACQASGKGRAATCTIRGDNGIIALYPVGRGGTLTISVPPEINPGLIDLVGWQAAQDIENMLE